MKAAFPVLEAAVLGLNLVPGSRIVVAVSGGPDSVALLYALHSVVGARDWDLLVAHVNHSLRGPESDADEAFARALADQLELPFEMAGVDTRQASREERLSTETAARQLRYTALERIRAEWRGDVIATGHTQDDQAETVLLNLIRGAGLRGLGGMRPKIGSIVRPFLTVDRATIMAALRERGLTFRVDPSNADLRHRRNVIRERVVPVLQELQPQIVPVLGRTARQSQIDGDLVAAEAERALTALSVDGGDESVAMAAATWQALHPSLRHAVLRHIIGDLLGDLRDVHESHIERLDEAVRDRTPLADQLPRGLLLSVEEDTFRLHTQQLRGAEAIHERSKLGRDMIDTNLGRLGIVDLHHLDRADLDRLVRVCGPLNALIDADRLQGDLRVRAWEAGDRMHPMGGPGSRKLQDLFVDRHLPRASRVRVPVVGDGLGIVWVVGVALDRRVAISPATTRVLRLRWTPNGPE
jgi:tRNA(Ile)-lysidine synthase